MNTLFLLVGLAFIGLGIYAFLSGSLFGTVISLVIGGGLAGYSIFIPSERQISRKLQKGISSGLLELGEKKMRNGSFHADPDKFRNVVEKLTPILSGLSSMPEIGFDSIYIHFLKESEAEATMEDLSKMSLSASIIQNKSDWAVKIDLS